MQWGVDLVDPISYSALGFIFLWTPYIFGENKYFHKIKVILFIIPRELLMNSPEINNLLGIE